MDSDSILTLKSTNERFIIQRPFSTVHNVFVGEMFIWNEGKTICKNIDTGDYCEIILPSLGVFKEKNYKIKGQAYNSK
jgi:hypothetical protein